MSGVRQGSSDDRTPGAQSGCGAIASFQYHHLLDGCWSSDH
jgi:hypothetical protein